jgi:hypothetical protein
MKISGIGFAIVLIAFLMPFMVVKCADTPIMTLTGLKMATGGTVQTQTMDSMMEGIDSSSDSLKAGDEKKSDKKEESANQRNVKVNIFALSGLIAGMGGLITTLILNKRKYLVPLAIAGVGVIALILIKTAMQTNMTLKEAGKFASLISFEYQFGYFLALFGFVVGAVLAVLAGTDKLPFRKPVQVASPDAMSLSESTDETPALEEMEEEAMPGEDVQLAEAPEAEPVIETEKEPAPEKDSDNTV